MQQIQLPKSDIHFWVETKDGKIIDPYFPEYDVIAKINNVAPRRNYKAAPEEVQEYFIKLYREYWLQQKHHLMMWNLSWENTRNYCCFNAFNETEVNEGKVVVGSMGFGEKGKIFWEFGNPSWTEVKQFLK